VRGAGISHSSNKANDNDIFSERQAAAVESSVTVDRHHHCHHHHHHGFSSLLTAAPNDRHELISCQLNAHPHRVGACRTASGTAAAEQLTTSTVPSTVSRIRQ